MLHTALVNVPNGWRSSYGHLRSLCLSIYLFVVNITLWVLERLVLKSVAQRTSQCIKWASGARVMIIFDRCDSRSLDRSIARLFDRSIARSIVRSLARSIAHSFARDRSLDLSVYRSVYRLLARALARSIALIQFSPVQSSPVRVLFLLWSE